MQKIILIILDGFGEGKAYPGNAITLAKTLNITALKKTYPWTLLKAHGSAVGVSEGTQGGSEVGHFTIGAGRIVLQLLEEINIAIKNKSFFKMPALRDAFKRVNENDKAALHLLGMISDQGIHSHTEHLYALLELAKEQNVKKIYIHAITDGRDVPERSASEFVKQIQNKISELKLGNRAKIATIIGRYYAMDRDLNWDRVKKAYDLYTLGKGAGEKDPVQAIENAYKRGAATDYYIEPVILDEHAKILDKDSVIFWNFRADRARQLTWLFTGEKNPDTGKEPDFKPEKTVRPYFVCFGPYSGKAPVLFHPPVIKNNLGETISNLGLKQFRIAETDKFAHATFFFNAEREQPFSGEDRLLIESPKCPSYAEKPEMSAREITQKLLPKIDSDEYSLIVANFANCDLVGHSGVLKAAITAVETSDECIGKIVPEALKHDYIILITADHGNAEYMIYDDGSPCPSHTLNPVPLIVIGKNIQNWKLRSGGGLQDVAPTILEIMGLEKSKEMTGESLLIR